MKDLIIADVTRIFRKPTYRVALLVCLGLSLIWAIRTRVNVWNGYTFVTGQAGVLKISGLILGISIYLSVYADEFSSNSMQCLIGHGISRFRLLFAKFIDCVIVTVASFLIYYFFTMMLGLALGAGINSSELRYISGLILVWMFRSLGYATFSMIVLYWTKNVILATVTDAILLFSAATLLSFLNSIPVLKFYHLDTYIFDGMLTSANSAILLGQPYGWLWILFAVAKICIFSIVVSFLLFRKKELDF
ncbi:hypothetical protein SAMN02910292_01313 [Lachnospiraceae bacterium XBB2008]|nr:hypothetical protein SAMN02910292_01313 [Lachnospiraceae bacterium XBB2008]